MGISTIAVLACVAFRSNAPASPEEQTKTIVAAANDFLATLNPGQRTTAQYEFLRPKTATATQFDMSKMRFGGPPNGDSTHRPFGAKDGGAGGNGSGNSGGSSNGSGNPTPVPSS